jgi:enhancing lycopene biosynthesis protein 2
MEIEILGTGCTKCTTMEQMAKKALSQIGGFHTIKKVEDIVEIMNYNVIDTPALVINKVVKSSGKLLDDKEILAFMKEYI